jgi:hypothetical protein
VLGRKDCKLIRLTIGTKGQWQLVLESEWSPNLDTVITYGITVKIRFGTKLHYFTFKVGDYFHLVVYKRYQTRFVAS